MNHPTYEVLIQYIEKQLPEKESGLVEAHLSEPCTRCSEKIARLNLVLKAAARDHTRAPSPKVLRRAVALHNRRTPKIPGEPKLRILAKLLFDNSLQLSAMPVRGGASAPRRMLFTTQEVDIDLKITPERGDNHLFGQILSSDKDNEAAEAFVSLKSESGEILRGAETDSHGQFTFGQIPPGTYDLVFDLENQEVAITSLEFYDDK